jgi:hypothetical protein
MKHFAATHHFASNIRHYIDSIYYFKFQRRGHIQLELSPHLRQDIGEDDVRPAAKASLLQQQTAHAYSIDAIILRAF